MALSVDYLYRYALALIRKNQSSSLSSTEFGYFWNDAQNAYMGDLLGRFQNRNNGKSGNNTGIIQNAEILTLLSPFTTPNTLSVSAGQANKPANFIRGLALRVNDHEVYMINKGQIQSVLNSVIDPPSISENTYYGTEYEGYYKIWPSTVTSLDLDYIRKPAQVIWNFSFDGNNRQVYDPTGSVQSEWDLLSDMEITKRMLKGLGVSFSSQDFAGFGQSVINSGE